MYVIERDTMIQNDQNTHLNVGDLTKITKYSGMINQWNTMNITVSSLMNLNWTKKLFSEMDMPHPNHGKKSVSVM